MEATTTIVATYRITNLDGRVWDHHQEFEGDDETEAFNQASDILVEICSFDKTANVKLDYMVK